jgi:Ni2+-binding GTPase involved in maturation of urease and hydrogenase
MDVHLVGGFLGSGKTTAIIGAARELMSAGKRVGVVTNDQGRYLVDTAFVSRQGIPAVEVTGGCFCCRYEDLEKRLDWLQAVARPDIVFAESVGSCADLVATVIKPLLELRRKDPARPSLSVFVDGRLLQRRLLGRPLLFSEDVGYIFDKQLEEAGLLVINKMDLLDAPAAEELETLARQRFSTKSLRFQNSLDPTSLAAWLKDLETEAGLFPGPTLDIDYARYGAGEARLAWLDEEIALDFPPGQGRYVLSAIIGAIMGSLRQWQAPVGHVKFLIRGETGEHKLSFVAPAETDWQEQIPLIVDDHLTLLINARVEIEASALRQIVQDALEGSARQGNFTYAEASQAAFHPGFPRPTHRLT